MSADRERRYLTVIRWPDGWQRDDVVTLLASATAIDAATLRTRLGAPPHIIGLVPPDSALNAVIALQESGGDAFTCTHEDLASLGPTLRIRDLRLEEGRLAVELWHGAPTVIESRRIDVLVRAHTSEETAVRRPAPRPDGASMWAWDAFGGYGWAARLRARETFTDLETIDRRVAVSHVLDLHTSDRRVFQIDGDKFGFRVLGDLRGHSDNVNIDRMCELLTHLVPDVVVDAYFRLWRPPPAFDRLRLPMMRINDEDPAFAFYSRWAALMYRHVMA